MNSTSPRYGSQRGAPTSASPRSAEEVQALLGASRPGSGGGGGPGSGGGSGGSSRTGRKELVADRLLRQQFMWLSAWYACSMGTLFLNKIILTDLKGNFHTLAMVQMCTTATLGAAKVYGPRLLGRRSVDDPVQEMSGREDQREALAAFRRNMLLVAAMRGATVLLGLVSLAHVAVSFTETIKSTAPFFTVIFARLILGVRTSPQVQLSLLPVMIGLIICADTEVHELFDALNP